MSLWGLDPDATPVLGAGGVGALEAAYAGTGGPATGWDIPGTDITIPSPGDVAQGAKDTAGTVAANVPNPVEAAKDVVGQTTQSIFSAILGPGLELVLTAVLVGAGAVLWIWALIRGAQNSKIQKKGEALVSAAAGVATPT